MKDIKKVAVLGSGLMGRQIALNTAMNGYQVVLNDNNATALKAGEDWIENYLKERITKGKMTEDQVKDAKAHLSYESDLEKAVKGSDLVIEAIIEDKGIKEELFKKLDKMVDKDTIIATNSSYMVSSTFKDCVSNPGRLANLHYFNPAMVMKAVEVVKGEHTSEDTVLALIDFVKKTKKLPVRLNKEIDGFIANRILRAVRTEACSLMEAGIATPQDIDMAVENALNYPMGPFRLQDLTGIDLAYHSQKRVFDETGVKLPGYEAIVEKFNAGHFGKKSGKGWYDYTDKK